MVRIRNNYRETQQGWTIIELLVVVFVIVISRLIGQFFAREYGLWSGIGAGILSAGLCALAIVFLYRIFGRRHEELRREVREKYRGIYRVLAIPVDAHLVCKPPGAEIVVGDYGWEAESLNSADGLIYLQGLTDGWHVVWYAGFRPDQLTSVGLKPRSQYDWSYSWTIKPPPCPFPIQERETPSMGLPNVRKRQ